MFVELIGGFVGDLLEMVKFGNCYLVIILIIVGVCFMGELVKILILEKCILMLMFEVECFFDFGCLVDKFIEFCDVYFDYMVVVYVNMLVVVKVCVDWVVILSIVLEIVEYLDFEGKFIIWGLD